MRNKPLLFVILTIAGAACIRLPTPPTPMATQWPTGTTLDLQGTEDTVTATEQAHQETFAVQPTPPPTEPITVAATLEPVPTSIFADMALTHWAYEARKWAYERSYIPACEVEGGDGGPTGIYGCPEKSFQIWEQIVSGVRFNHRNGGFQPPAATGRAFDDPGFNGHEGEAWAEQASRDGKLPDYWLIAYPNRHFIGPFRAASVCDGHVYIRVLLYGTDLTFPDYNAQEAQRTFDDWWRADRLCLQSAMVNIKEQIWYLGPAKSLYPNDPLTWGYWSALLFNGDAVRNRTSSSPAASP